MDRSVELPSVRCPEIGCPLNCDGSCQDISTILLDVPDPDYGCDFGCIRATSKPSDASDPLLC